jgi:hypothetical protein
MRAFFVLIACASLLVVSALPADAASGPPPPLSCHPGVGPCQETDHFGELTFLGRPLPGCAALSEWALVNTVGNGVQHATTNAAQDFWLTTTVEGAATIVQGTVVLDSNGNPIKFTPDPTQPTYSGHLQDWFGESINNKNMSISSTANFQGTSSTGVAFSLHLNAHMNTTGSQPLLPNSSSLHLDITCG